MLNLQSIILNAVIISYASVIALNIEGYYWRVYKGIVPGDALPGGVDLNGNPIFMGEALYDGKTWPVKIYPLDNKGYFGYGGKEYGVTEDIKILCTQEPNKFYWIPTKNDEIHLLTNHHLIVGGSHPGKTMYFGRVFFRTETSVGRVSTDKPAPQNNRGLYISQNGQEFNFHSFEILVYNTTNTSTVPVNGTSCQ